MGGADQTMKSISKPGGPRYVLCPGLIRSKSDGQKHFISAHKLARLYGVPFAECLVYQFPDTPEGEIRRRLWRPPENAVYLHPRYDGAYTLKSRE